MEQKLIAHLQKENIGLVFENMSEREKYCVVGLKIMCIINYEAKKAGIYDVIEQNKYGMKFLMDLLRLPAYCTFNYAEYKINGIDDSLLLACKDCKFIGPYKYTLSHMAISHGDHVTLNVCNYCNEVGLREHIKKKSLNACYEEYRQANSIDDDLHQDMKNTVIKKFYEGLRSMAKELEVLIERKQFAGAESKKKLMLERNIGHGMQNMFHYVPKPMNMVKLEQKFQSVINAMFNGSLPNILYQEDEAGVCTVFESDDDDVNAVITSGINSHDIDLTRSGEPISHIDSSGKSFDDSSCVPSVRPKRVIKVRGKKGVVPAKERIVSPKGVVRERRISIADIIQLCSKIGEISQNIPKVIPQKSEPHTQIEHSVGIRLITSTCNRYNLKTDF